MKIIVSKSLFEELNLKSTSKDRFIGHGTYQYAFNHSDPDKVIKKGRNYRTDKIDPQSDTVIKYEGRDYNEGELWEFEEMQKYPKFFPIIYRIDKKAIVMQKLDGEKAKSQFLQIQFAITARFPGLKFDDFLSQYKEIGKFHKMDDQMSDMYQYLKNKNPELMGNFYRFCYLVWNIMELKLFDIDVSQSNFGYDKLGNLKMLDV